MDYIVEFYGNEIELPKYSLEITDKVEKVESTIARLSTVREQIKTVYKFLEDLLGKETVKTLLGSFASCDPNDINILYLKIVKCYNKPIENFQTESIKSDIDETGVNELIPLLEALKQANVLPTKNGVPYKVK